MPKKYFRIVMATIVLAIFLQPASSSAGDSYTDPDDMTSPIDVRELVFEPARGGGGRLTLTTDDRWDCDYLQPRLNSIKWKFDGRADGDTDLVGNVRCDGRRPQLFLRGTETENRYEPVDGTRPDRRSISFSFSFDIAELEGRHVSLFIDISDGAAEGCTSAAPCFDRAPNRGRWSLY